MSQILPNKHSSWWRRTEDVLETSWRRLEDIITRRLANTSWRRLEDITARRLTNTSWRRLEDVLEDTKSVTLKTSSRRLGKQKMFVGWLHASLTTNLKTFSEKLLTVSPENWTRRKKIKNTVIAIEKLFPLNANAMNWSIYFFKEGWRQFAVGTIENDSSFSTWQSKFYGRFQPILFILTSRLLYFLEKSNPASYSDFLSRLFGN